MDCGGYAGEAFEQARAGGVEELVRDAEDPALADGAEMMPVALRYDPFEGNAISSSAPGEEEDIGIGCGDGVRCSVSTGLAEVLASGSFYQLCYPALGVNEGFAPLFTIDNGGVGSRERLPTGHLDG